MKVNPEYNKILAEALAKADAQKDFIPNKQKGINMDEQDRKFLVDILFLIRDYARDNGMDEDDTIRTVANNMLALLKIATFKHISGKEN